MSFNFLRSITVMGLFLFFSVASFADGMDGEKK